jgi:hypothetical protein
VEDGAALRWIMASQRVGYSRLGVLETHLDDARPLRPCPVPALELEQTDPTDEAKPLARSDLVVRRWLEPLSVELDFDGPPGRVERD